MGEGEVPEEALEEVEEQVEEVPEEARPDPRKLVTPSSAYGALWGFVGAGLAVFSVPPPASPFQNGQYIVTLIGTIIFTFIFVGIWAWALYAILRFRSNLSVGGFAGGYIFGSVVLVILAYGLKLPYQLLDAGGYPPTCSGILFMFLPIADLVILPMALGRWRKSGVAGEY